MNDSPDIAEITALRQQTEELIAQIDAVLAQGAAAEAYARRLYAASGREEGFGRAALLSPDVPLDDQYAFRRLLDEREHLEERIAAMKTCETSAAPRSAGAKAVSSRFRI